MESDDNINSPDGSVVEDEPLLPDDVDEDFYNNLRSKVNDLIKYTRNKLNNAVQADNLQRMQLLCNKYKSDLLQEEDKNLKLSEKLQVTEGNLEEALKKLDLDQDVIKELRKVIETAWRQKDAAQARDQAAQEELQKLLQKVEDIESSVKMFSERRGGGESFARLREEANKEREKFTMEIKELNRKLQSQRTYANELEQNAIKLEEKNKNVIDILDETTSECYREKKKCNALSKELAELKVIEEKNEEKIKKIQTQNEHLSKQHIQQNLQILAAKTNLEQTRSVQTITNNKLMKTMTEIEILNEEKDKIKTELLQKTNYLKVREVFFSKMKQENSKVTRSQEGLIRKMKAMQRAKDRAEIEVSNTRTQVNNVEKELSDEKKTFERLKKKIHDLTYERDHLKRELIIKKSLIQKGEENLQMCQQELKIANDTNVENLVKEKKLLDNLEKAKQLTGKKCDDIQKLMEQINSMELQNRYKENVINDLNQELADVRSESNKIQGTLEIIRNEKKCFERKCQQISNENDKMNSELELAKNEIINYKEKITIKLEEINKLQIQIEKMAKERQVLHTEKRNIQTIYQHTRSELVEKRLEIDRLTKVLQENNERFQKDEKKLQNCLDEKNVIESNLAKLNVNYEQLKNQLQLTKKNLEQCEKLNSDSLEKNRLLKIEVKNAQNDRQIFKFERECKNEMQTDVSQLARALNQEKIKSKALEDELMRPLNVHRWRTLAGRDPEKLDLINKIQILQKQILAQNVLALEREKALEESHKLYTALKQFMMKLPSYKIKEQLNEIKHNLSVKQKKLKAVTAELNTKEIDEKSKEVTVAELRMNLTSAKKELCEERKKKIKLLEERHIIAEMQLQCFSAPATGQQSSSRMFGAGFRMPPSYT